MSEIEILLPASMGETLLRTQGLVKRFGGVIATDQVSIDMQRGEVLGIIGPNGAGKSTLVGLLGGALKPSEGRIWLDGVDISNWSAAARARQGVGRTYQIPRPFLDMTVRENLLAARYSRHPFASRAHAREACDRILERVGLTHVADRGARTLPLLRRKRLEVARALALEPKLLLLDEVGAGLVDAEVSELIQLLHSLRHEVGGIVIIEHVLRVVRECCQRLVVLNFGRVLAQGPTARVLASDEVAAVYLGAAHGSPPLPGIVRPAVASSLGVASPDVSALVAPDLMDKAPLLELRGVHAGYGQARVLTGVDLTVRSGRVTALLGTNGAGKTTLAKVISGALQVQAGELRIRGQDRTKMAAHEVARAGFAQCMEGRRIFAALSVEENLVVAARTAPPSERGRRLAQVYTLFPELAQRRQQMGTLLSGGQQQMLAIGRAMMSRPQFVLFDEISLGLAPLVMDRLYTALANLRRAGLTMIIVEQDVERALALADEAHVLERGRIVMSGPPDSIRGNPQLRHLYVGTGP